MGLKEGFRAWFEEQEGLTPTHGGVFCCHCHQQGEQGGLLEWTEEDVAMYITLRHDIGMIRIVFHSRYAFGLDDGHIFADKKSGKDLSFPDVFSGLHYVFPGCRRL